MVGQMEHLTLELSAVWDEMFDAVAAILKAAERIGGIADNVHGNAGADLSQAVGEIFEACAFQDITGQRIAKVVAELAIDGRDISAPPTAPLFSPADFRTANDDDLLNGPQLPGNALSQDAVDDLFSGFVTKA